MSWPKSVLFPKFGVSAFAALSLFVGGCAGSDETGDETGETDDQVVPLAIVGDWAEVAGSFPTLEVWGYHAIDDALWTDAFGSTYAIAQYDNDAGFVIAQNDASNPYYPDAWSRFDVTSDGDGGWYYCQTAFAAASEADALATPSADDSDPATTGCGTFPWSHLIATLPVTGVWDDGFSVHHVDEATWGMGDDTFAIFDVDFAASFLIAQNASDNAFNPGKWSRFDWVIAGTDVSYCQAAYDAETAEAAAAISADHTDLAAGCGGFAWSTLTATAD